ncbi:ABC transporter permease [Alkaliphilus serpentinus]|uniref:ABC transporter permease n=1 Tax=Alkaliphilus serpentinus TaxID=1482731 RepID=A0A833HPJ4_9FIRM|nr:ABC transporter permease [Alkaliphilus serpentinus]KAB3530751.1 ABC transporter permease [Alkaliphilus serpentinus]
MKILIITLFKLKGLLKSRTAWLTVFIIPLLFTLLAGSIYSPKTASDRIPIAIVDEDNSQFSRFLIELIKNEELLEVLETDEEHGLNLVKEHKVEGTYIIKKGFQAEIKKDSNPEIDVLKSSNSYGADAISEIIASGLVRLQSNARAANIIVKEYDKERSLTEDEKEKLWMEVYNHSESYWYPQQLMKLEYQSLYLNQTSDEKTNIVGFSEGPFGVLITFLALSGIYGLGAFSKEHKSESFKRLYLITNSSKTLILGNIIPLLIILSFQGCILFYTLNQFFDLYLDVSYIYLTITVFAYLLLISSLVILISTFSYRGENLQNKYSIFVILSSVIGGSFWSVDLMPKILQRLALFTPQGITMEMFKMTVLNNFNGVVLYFIMIVAAALLLMIISNIRIKALVN